MPPNHSGHLAGEFKYFLSEGHFIKQCYTHFICNYRDARVLYIKKKLKEYLTRVNTTLLLHFIHLKIKAYIWHILLQNELGD